MATKTTNLGLTKPDPNDYYDVDVFNGNADILDDKISNLKSGSHTFSGTATGTYTYNSSLGYYVYNNYIAFPYGIPDFLLIGPINPIGGHNNTVGQVVFPTETDYVFVTASYNGDADFSLFRATLTWSDTKLHIYGSARDCGNIRYTLYYSDRKGA